jgi:hypothetical protein
MSDTCPTVKIMPSHESQGDYVEINASDFDPAKHELFGGLTAPQAGKPSDGLTVAEIKEALAARNIAIPDGVTLKADLAKLLDEAP